MRSKDIVHGCSVEHIYHYQCGICLAGWSVSNRYEEVPTCPRCGKNAPAFKLTTPLQPPPH